MKKDEIEALKTEVTQLRLSEGAKAERLGQLEADQRHLNDKLSAAERSVLELSEAKSELQRQLQAQRDASDSSKDTVDKMQQVRVGVCGTAWDHCCCPVRWCVHCSHRLPTVVCTARRW